MVSTSSSSCLSGRECAKKIQHCDVTKVTSASQMGGGGFRSTRVSMFANDARGVDLGRDGLVLVQALAKLGEGWDRREFLNLRQKITGQRHTRLGGASLKAPVQSIRHVTNLNRFRHVANRVLISCAAHVHEISFKFRDLKPRASSVPSFPTSLGSACAERGPRDRARGILPGLTLSPRSRALLLRTQWEPAERAGTRFPSQPAQPDRRQTARRQYRSARWSS